MKIAIIGASAGTGLEVTKLALARGHEVVTLSRSIDALPDHPRITRVQGSSTKRADVRAVLGSGVDAVLITLGTRNSLKATTLFSDSATVILQVLKECQLSCPVQVLSGFGANESADYNSFLPKLFFRFVLKEVYVDKGKAEKLFAAGYQNWIIVRPGRLTNGKMRERYRVLDKLTTGMKVGMISRADVAHFMVTQAEQPTYIGKYPALTY